MKVAHENEATVPLLRLPKDTTPHKAEGVF